jgi:carbamoyltransferase
MLRESEIKLDGGKTTGEVCRELGISAYYHDSAAAIIRNGEVVAAAQEERFTRKKHDSRFPSLAIEYCLSESGIKLSGLSKITFYDKPLIKFERLLETYLSYASKHFRSFLAAMPVWLKKILINNRNHEQDEWPRNLVLANNKTNC